MAVELESIVRENAEKRKPAQAILERAFVKN
jgi:hypothetical protein